MGVGERWGGGILPYARFALRVFEAVRGGGVRGTGERWGEGSPYARFTLRVFEAVRGGRVNVIKGVVGAVHRRRNY